MRTSVGLRGQVHPVPVDRGRLRELVSDAKLDPVASLGAQGRLEVSAVRAPCVGHLVGEKLGLTNLQLEVEDLAPATSLGSRSGGTASSLRKRSSPTVLVRASV